MILPGCDSLLSFECDIIHHVYSYIGPFPAEITTMQFKTEVVADLLFIYTYNILWPNYPLMVQMSENGKET